MSSNIPVIDPNAKAPPAPAPDPCAITAAELPAAGKPAMSAIPDLPLSPMASIEGYTLLREIARGGQGAVYEATRKSTGRRVAIKVLTGGAFAGPREKARFDREVQILAALDHPNIVRIIDRGTTTDGSLFLVMDFISGRPLDQYLHAYYHAHPEGPPPADASELLRLFMKICDAVNAAHLRGVIHRDLKPSNIRITENGEPYILDFGLARTALSAAGVDGEMMSLTGQFLGTLAWASPEQAEGNSSKIDTRTDVYSLGIILYQMLTQRFPYEVAGNMREVLNNIVNSHPTPPSKVIPVSQAKSSNGKRRLHLKASGKVNMVLEAIILKALAKHRTDRYQTAGELARDMANYLSGRPTIAAGAPPSMWQKKNTKSIVAVAALILVALSLTGAWLHQRAHNLLNDTKPDTAQMMTRKDDGAADTSAAVIPFAPSTPDSRIVSDQFPDSPVLTSAGMPSSSTGKTVVDLLPLLRDPGPLRSRGVWHGNLEGITSSMANTTLLPVPYVPPQEYDFIIEFTPLEGHCNLGQGLTHGNATLGWANGYNDIRKLPGFEFGSHTVSANSPAALCQGPLELGHRYRSEIHVRNDSVAEFFDGTLISECKINYSQANLVPEVWPTPASSHGTAASCFTPYAWLR